MARHNNVFPLGLGSLVDVHLVHFPEEFASLFWVLIEVDEQVVQVGHTIFVC